MVLAEFIKDATNALEPNIQVKNHIKAGSLAVAGPIMANKVIFTNTVSHKPFVICGNDIQREFNIPSVKLLNDFTANGYGLLTLEEYEKSIIREAKNHVEGPAPIACLGAGTGLGECFLTPDAQGNYTAFPTEGGHCEFAPRNELEIKLLQYLHKKFAPLAPEGKEQVAHGRVSVERVLSGKGLVNVYEFLSHEFPEKVLDSYHEKIMSSSEGGREISDLYYDYPLCKQAVNIMLSTYGAEAGNLCLKYLCYGGLYIAGGIAPVHEQKMVDPAQSDFLAAFTDKGRLSGVLDNVTVYLVKVDDLGLRGAHFVANYLYSQNRNAPCPAEAVAAITPSVVTTTTTVTPGSISDAGQVPTAQCVNCPCAEKVCQSPFRTIGMITVAVLASVGLLTVYKAVAEK
eukprot:TRINITY_DN16908_c0_g1_i1.p1 TRINITY_DN16908_c0_g1~~TRINITY_DN16908_c0_g1_i1.p1  ORF type:complete len:453 (-),score=110.55 TRINITY_DN16908_c0_g1_i1:90-1289(-)